MKHTGPAVVFSDVDDMYKRIDDPNLNVTKDSVLVLQNAGPKGAPGMPEWGQLPIPKKLLEQGVRDMVRLSDCRMSGTSYGACVLHIAPEAAIGGPLALVQEGDMITLDVEARVLRLEVSDEELADRMSHWIAPEEAYTQRLWPPVPGPHHPGRPGLRLRLPARRRADAGAEDLLKPHPFFPTSGLIRERHSCLRDAAANPIRRSAHHLV